MFGLMKRAEAPALPRVDPRAPREGAISAAGGALEGAARLLTDGLRSIGIDSVHLAEHAELPILPVSLLMERSLIFDQQGRRCALLIGETGDFETYSLAPHYRYREIHLLIEELEALAPGRFEEREKLIRQHAAHALIHTQMLRFFLLRVSTVERFVAGNRMDDVKREMMMNVEAIAGLTTGLPAALARGLDLAATRQEWNCWPEIMVETAEA